MQSSQFSALARPLDISYRTNLSIMLMSFFVMLIAFFYQWWHLDNALWESLWWAAQAGLSVFLAWALGREIDPDVNSTAFLAAFLSLAGFYYTGSYQWGLLIAFLMILRISSHICGQQIKLTDALFCLALCAYLCWQGQALIGFAFTAAFLADSRLAPVHVRSQWYALAALIITILAFIFFPVSITDTYFQFSGIWIPGIGVVVLIFLQVIREYKNPGSTEDYKTQPLNGHRIQAAQLIVLLTALSIYLLQNYRTTLEIAPVWAVILSAELLRVYRWITKRPLY
ncbi:hypothetical protein [Catalinimonas niigatensis]|uniref:hypothetical protein n=1 Tax=Catalinimonas niigatensis TaxID=1397264 RepID=UPI002666CF63|nr:hypothetical protein [Catalinimonas niigatensis]WPP52653.1 hypothetical protein PZB72_09695 [Catalinimonas niigatensis]